MHAVKMQREAAIFFHGEQTAVQAFPVERKFQHDNRCSAAKKPSMEKKTFFSCLKIDSSFETLEAAAQ